MAEAAERTLTYTPDRFHVGDHDTRPWGKWEVTAVRQENGEQHVEKHLTVNPNAILSLQSHKLRREVWTVLEGKIEATRGDEVITVSKGETIEIPRGAQHRIANPFSETAIVHEIQRGICREDDIERYEDKYGRA